MEDGERAKALEEARVFRMLDNANIVKYITNVIEDSTLYIVMGVRGAIRIHQSCV